MIVYVGDFQLLEKKYGFHKGYQQHNDNKRDYGVLTSDNVRISESGVITVGHDLWISSKDYYHFGYLDKIYEMFKDGVIKLEEKLK